jgi:hypothetical protein
LIETPIIIEHRLSSKQRRNAYLLGTRIFKGQISGGWGYLGRIFGF